MLTIRKGGLQTTVQDLGRSGFQKYGVVAAGAIDPFAFRIANLLVGNEENAAAIEIQLIGPEIQFEEDTLIAICGGNLSPQLDGETADSWRPVAVAKGQTLTFGKPTAGSRCYLAVAGGIDVPLVMNSRSTYLRAAIGGYQGRALTQGDRLAVGGENGRNESSDQKTAWSVPAPVYSAEPVIRVTAGRQFDLFAADSRKCFFSEPFSLSPHSDRMGCRLNGSQLALSEKQELVSEAVAFGSIQVPADGNPIILMADRQTTGGYPKIAEVITADLPLVSQLKPGDSIRFKKVSVEEAQRQLRLQERRISCLKRAIRLKWEALK